MKMTIDEACRQQLLNAADQLGVPLSESHLQNIADFLVGLDKYSRHTNLVSRSDAATVISQHVIDALSLVPIINRLADVSPSPLRLVDIGSGAGFPALILAVVMDRLSIDMIESVGKKTRFLSESVARLGLGQRVNVHNCRAEDLAHQSKFRGRFDFATARAVGKIELVCELTVPFLKDGGYLLAQKSSQQLDEELLSANTAMEILGCELGELVVPDKVALGKDVVVALIKKIKVTPPRLPRVSAQLKKPLV